tara:strand:- start:139 stop:405 length:267 start_codon:yes stop_codon:yes gene_type:complete
MSETTDKMVLCWKDTFGTDREYEMAFGYDASDGEPTVAIMWEGCEHPLSIPITVMLEAIATGWNGDFGNSPFLPKPFMSFMPGDPALN